QCDPAVVVGRAVIERHVAGAHEVARTRLEVAPLQAPGHLTLRSRCRWAHCAEFSGPLHGSSKTSVSGRGKLRIAPRMRGLAAASTLERMSSCLALQTVDRWPTWARWNETPAHRYTLGVEEEVMLVSASDHAFAHSSDAVLRRLPDELAQQMS